MPLIVLTHGMKEVTAFLRSRDCSGRNHDDDNTDSFAWRGLNDCVNYSEQTASLPPPARPLPTGLIPLPSAPRQSAPSF